MALFIPSHLLLYVRGETAENSNLTHHQLLCQLSWKSLKARSTIHNLTFAFKCLHNIAPDLFKSYFNRFSHVYSTRRNGLDTLIPKVRTESANKGTFVLEPRLLITCHPI